MKDYQKIPIAECFEPLIPIIPTDNLAIYNPHPYQKLGANYRGKSPYCLRQGVLAALIRATEKLQKKRSGWQIKIFDAYRPVEVQQFMVEYSFNAAIASLNLEGENLSDRQRQSIWQQVYQIWALPSLDPLTPPPHSTGAAIDVTLVNERGMTIDMGSEIDEMSPRSHPDYYANTDRKYHCKRQLLHEIMKAEGFSRHPREWWHFSLGDQMWAWLQNKDSAYYGRVNC